jgi:hypothetical protein
VSDLSNQKYLFFYVPNYDGSNAADGTGSPLSYFQLGSAKSNDNIASSAKRGDDLLEAAGLSTSSYASFFVDDGRGGECESKSEAESSPYSEAVHYDGEHEKEECLAADPDELETSYYRSKEKDVFTSAASKTALSAELLGDGTSTDPRGGFRDHTDGNRIVTVRGDRVDVVVGNYKRVVFGRVSGDHVGASSYEAAGGHLFERSSTGAVELYAIEHVEETVDGSSRWKIVERAHEADHVERWSGTLAEHHNGPVRKTIIGTGEESTTENPEISMSRNVGTFTTTITADSIERSTEVDVYSDETDGGGAGIGETIIATTYERARGKSSQRHFSFKDELFCKRAIEIKAFVGAFDLELGETLFDDEIEEVKITAGLKLEAQIGARFEFHYGTDTRIEFAPVIKKTIGVALDVDVGFYGHASLFYWNYVAAEGEMRVGDLEIEYLRKEDSVADSRAFALLAHL